MWQHDATQANIATLRTRGVTVIEPDEGPMACGEFGPGRLPEPVDILKALGPFLSVCPEPVEGLPLSSGEADQGSASTSSARTEFLTGKHILITAGPTHEPIDPVRVIANRSSGKQGFAIAAAAAQAGARVTLIAGPVSLATPGGVARVDVETAQQMADAVENALPADVAILVAAVADWRVDAAASKLKKSDGPPVLSFKPNPDILQILGEHPDRPELLVGFAAETNDVVPNAETKLRSKKADWIVANDVSGDVMGGHRNRIHLVTKDGVEDWPEAAKEDVARHLVERIAQELE
jgi:phosphopantothenoylcysteine decarboxylase/phosphopantothenate--cysteine ligase